MVELHCCDETRGRGETFLNCFFDFFDFDLAETFYLQEGLTGGAVDGLDGWLGWGWHGLGLCLGMRWLGLRY